ncbi:MAG TPA: pyridoxamine 5'-phosphate oxidase family protein [Pseudonocardiaceae bacterium]|nr:pyridoxamine 5'-phosphate oxidase family protein [Pseudonocardiaceae bacterium]
MNAGTTPPMPAAIRQSLASYTTMTLAYVDESGPGACAVLYAPATGPRPALVFVTSTSTRHGRALQDQSPAQVAFTAQQDGQEWSDLTGVQGRGRCQRLEGDDRNAAWDIYSARFPFVVADATLVAAMERTAMWAVAPTWLRLINNRTGFGHKDEWSAL